VGLEYLARIARVHLGALKRIAAGGHHAPHLPFFGGNLEA